MFRSITDEVAWVTGAGSGIGQAGAVALAKAGARLVLSGRQTEPLEETAGMIRAAGGTALVQPADVRDATQVRAVAKRIEDEFGRCDILVNSAGINVKNRSWGEVDPEGFDSVVEADLSGPFYACAAVLPMMRAQKGGLIIHISSWAGRLRVAAHRARLLGGKARARGAQREPEPGGVPARHPLVLHLPRRGRDADPRQATGAGHGRGQSAHAAVR
jgi:NAD(P)-dependent dehydrogenase (short-subunit alcohol dehydrogenase family)